MHFSPQNSVATNIRQGVTETLSSKCEIMNIRK